VCVRHRLAEILKHNPGPQMSYQVGFCFWLLTFDQEIAEQINKYVILSLLSSLHCTFIDVVYVTGRTTCKVPAIKV
jgi:hypothetical protein